MANRRTAIDDTLYDYLVAHGVREHPAQTALRQATLAQPHVSPMAPGPRHMPGWIVVAAEGVADDADLARWVATALDFVDTLPPK